MKMILYRDVIQDTAGNKQTGATVTVLDQEGDPAVIYYDEEGASVIADGEVDVDSNGEFSFYTEPATLDLSIELSDGTTRDLGNVSVGQQTRVATIAALRLLPTPARRVAVYVEGYYAAGDGGGGMMVWNPSSTAADDGGMYFRPSSEPATGRWLRGMGPSLRLRLSWFGAKFDGATNDYTAWAACTAYALSLSQHPTIEAPAGISRLYSPLIFNEIRSLTIVGQGTSAANGGTDVEYWVSTPNASQQKGLFQFYSCFHVKFENLNLRNRVTGLAATVWIDALNSPSLSSHCFDFNNVHFSPGGSCPASDADVVVANAKLVKFDSCRWTEISDKNIRVGHNVADSGSTLQQGIVEGVTLANCFMFGEVDLRHAAAWGLLGCVFGEDENAVVNSTGEKRMKNGRMSFCKFAGDSSRAAFTQGDHVGTADVGAAGSITLDNNMMRDRAVCVAITRGFITLDANQFIVRRVGDKGVTIASGADAVNITPSNDFSNAFANNLVAIEDNRASLKDQVILTLDLGANADLSGVGSFVDVLSDQPIRKLRGGKYRITYGVVVNASSDGTGTYRAKVLVGGVDYGTITKAYGVATNEVLLTFSRIVQLPATTSASAPTIRLQVQQDTGAVAANVRGGGNGNSFLQLEELP